MNIATAARAILAELGEAENAVSHGPELIALVTKGVHTSEALAGSGQDKLTAVLNQSEAFLAHAIPEAMADAQAILKAVEEFVNALVALYNEAGAFVHGVESALGIQSK